MSEFIKARIVEFPDNHTCVEEISKYKDILYHSYTKFNSKAEALEYMAKNDLIKGPDYVQA